MAIPDSARIDRETVAQRRAATVVTPCPPASGGRRPVRSQVS